MRTVSRWPWRARSVASRRAWLTISSAARRTMPRSAPPPPLIENVFPAPVCPYAITQTY